jgi:hypothetical protein
MPRGHKGEKRPADVIRNHRGCPGARTKLSSKRLSPSEIEIRTNCAPHVVS